jgi:hypothetical protein
MHKITDKKFYLGPKFGTLIYKKWITISGLLQYAPGLPWILLWRRGLLVAVGGGRAWLVSLRSPASAAPIGPLQPLIKQWLKVSSSSPAWAFCGEDLSWLLAQPDLRSEPASSAECRIDPWDVSPLVALPLARSRKTLTIHHRSASMFVLYLSIGRPIRTFVLSLHYR